MAITTVLEAAASPVRFCGPGVKVHTDESPHLRTKTCAVLSKDKPMTPISVYIILYLMQMLHGASIFTYKTGS